MSKLTIATVFSLVVLSSTAWSQSNGNYFGGNDDNGRFYRRDDGNLYDRSPTGLVIPTPDDAGLNYGRSGTGLNVPGQDPYGNGR